MVTDDGDKKGCGSKARHHLTKVRSKKMSMTNQILITLIVILMTISISVTDATIQIGQVCNLPNHQKCGYIDPMVNHHHVDCHVSLLKGKPVMSCRLMP
jgi:hypothetical protein